MGDREKVNELLRAIEACNLPKLPSDCDSSDHTSHYRTHGSTLRGRVGALRRRLASANVGQFSQEVRVEVVTHILILLHELRTKGPWSPEGFANHAALVEEAFTGSHDVSLDRFKQDAGDFKQAIFNSYLNAVHKKLTPQDWKKYPAIVEIYCSFLKEMDVMSKDKEFSSQVEIEPVRMLSPALLMIEDFNQTFKKMGLESCLSVLKHLTKDHFKDSNYHQVIYVVLKKVIRDEDIAIMKLSYDCMVCMMPLMQDDADCPWSQLDSLTKDVLDDVYVQSSLERKALSFDFLSKLIAIRKEDCVRFKKHFNLIVCDNLDLCSAENVRRILFKNLLLAFKTWLKYCWIIWKFETDHKILSLLLKLLYIQCADKVAKKKLDELEAVIVCVIALCTAEQQEDIMSSLRDGGTQIENAGYVERLKHVARSLTEAPAAPPKKGKEKKKGK